MRKFFNFVSRPDISFWGTIGVLILYPLSAGPFVWLIWNVRVPDWAASAILYFYQPFGWVVKKSEICHELWFWYAAIWTEMKGRPATNAPPEISPPPFFIEITSTLIGAWLIWNFVRWVNLRKTLTAPQVAP